MGKQNFGYRGYRPRSTLRSFDSAPSYFVPSYAVRRSVSPEDEAIFAMRKELYKVLGRAYIIKEAEKIGMTTVEQRAFIEKMRKAEVKPAPSEMRDLANNTREGLAEVITNTPHRLSLPIGRICRVGHFKDKLAFQPLGWKGYKARYAIASENGETLPLGSVISENRFCFKSIKEALAIDGLEGTPHVVLAKKPGGIRDHELRAIKNDVTSVLEDTMGAELGLYDPVIYLRTERTQRQAEIIYVRDVLNTSS